MRVIDTCIWFAYTVLYNISEIPTFIRNMRLPIRCVVFNAHWTLYKRPHSDFPESYTVLSEQIWDFRWERFFSRDIPRTESRVYGSIRKFQSFYGSMETNMKLPMRCIVFNARIARIESRLYDYTEFSKVPLFWMSIL